MSPKAVDNILESMYVPSDFATYLNLCPHWTTHFSQFLMPGLVDCHFHPSQYFRAGVDLPSFLDFLLDTSIAGDLLFRNTTYAREESMRIVVRACSPCL